MLLVVAVGFFFSLGSKHVQCRGNAACNQNHPQAAHIVSIFACLLRNLLLQPPPSATARRRKRRRWKEEEEGGERKGQRRTFLACLSPSFSQV